jgi:RNA polymerase sigma-70 factor (ECF subfamily)
VHPRGSHDYLGGNSVAMNFEDLVQTFYRPLYQFAYSLSRAEADACDLTQQTFYVWAQKGHQLKDEAKVKTWLFTTLHREFLRSRRRQTRFPHVDLDAAADELPSQEPLDVSGLDSSIVLDALAEVDERYRVPLSLFYMDDLPYQEIAEVLEVPLGTVQSRIARGKAQLQQNLARRQVTEVGA